MRVRVEINVMVPLKCTKKIITHGDKSFMVEFRYERLLIFCFLYGLLGHNERFCPRLFDGGGC